MKNLISTKNNEGNLNNLLRFIKAISPKQNSDSHNTILYDEKKEKDDDQVWLIDHLASRKHLVRILKTVYKIITFKKIVKFFTILGFLFFFPVMNKNNISKNVIDLNNDRDFDPFTYINSTDYRSVERFNFFINALEGFSGPLLVWCVAGYDAFCRFQTMFDTIDQIYTFDQIIQRFLPSGANAKLMSMINFIKPKIESTFIGVKKDFFEEGEEDEDDDSEEESYEE
ncbi:hypothetical protein PVAND_010754 [Polypedilum vanderplanki]|uniref:Uncharacterized protein n=1 Tax=Polypedilum vanderplanki TaxID=319348 RepID=A0A9J6CGJ7_POLVA|nr:hypothetical protein PVAND_010754 [Polypedilum vanderplanki]